MIDQKSLVPTAELIGAELSIAKVRISKFAILVGDVFAIMIAFSFATVACSWFVTGHFDRIQFWVSGQDIQRFWAWAAVAGFGLVALLMRYQHYSDRRPFWDEFGDLVRLVCLLALLDIAIVGIAKWNASRLWWAVSWVVVLLGFLVTRNITRRILKALHLWTRPTIIIGVGSNAAEASLALSSQPEMGLHVCGYVDVGRHDGVNDSNTYPRIPLEKMDAIAKKPGIQWVIALEHSQSGQREFWLRQLAKWGVSDVSVIPAMRGVPLHGTDMSHFFSHEVALLRMRNNLRRWPARLTKRIFDTLAAVVLMILLTPVMLFIAFLVRQDGGPALFAHPRIGKKGKVFNCYKFRTMHVDAENQIEQLLQKRPELRAQWESERKLRDDPRVSRWGQLLRKTSLDELPQLLNVIRGEMSLVGPRPVVSSELQRFGKDVGYYLMVRPGMTGLWQVNGRSDVDYDTRVYLDTWYVKNWSLWYDLIILFKTVRVVLTRSGAY